MQFRNEQELGKRLKKRVEYDLGRKSWSFNGIKFNSTAYYFEKDYFTTVEYVCDLRQISVTITRDKYGKFYEIIAEKSFNGDNAISDCIEWTVNKLVEVYKLLNDRLAPYQNDKLRYELAIKQPLNLQEAEV